MLFDAAQPPEKQDQLGIWHANVGTMTFFDSHAGTMTWKQYTNAVTGVEKAKQFFGGTIFLLELMCLFFGPPRGHWGAVPQTVIFMIAAGNIWVRPEWRLNKT